MKLHFGFSLFLFTSLIQGSLFAQDSNSCKVLVPTLTGKYIGACKHGLADGKGDATGIHHYVGSFKNGLPNGKGIYYYSNSMYHSGNFQDGLKEGKGETHYIREGLSDSIVKGFWSGDLYKGTKYETYLFNISQSSDLITEITPSSQTGNSITIEISTTTGSPNGTPTLSNGSSGFVLTLTNLLTVDGTVIKKLSGYTTSFKTTTTYELSKFPVKLIGNLSDGRTFELELFKAAEWTVRFNVNK
jgi:hypothetical protein